MRAEKEAEPGISTIRETAHPTPSSFSLSKSLRDGEINTHAQRDKEIERHMYTNIHTDAGAPLRTATCTSVYNHTHTKAQRTKRQEKRSALGGKTFPGTNVHARTNQPLSLQEKAVGAASSAGGSSSPLPPPKFPRKPSKKQLCQGTG